MIAPAVYQRKVDIGERLVRRIEQLGFGSHPLPLLVNIWMVRYTHQI